ncbi:hypothetical protein BY996DRAFT_6518886, partial [Phakopsora pachyrhizi]
SQPLPVRDGLNRLQYHPSGATPILGTLNATLWIQDGRPKTRPNQILKHLDKRPTLTRPLKALEHTVPPLSLIRPDSGDP